MKAFKWKVILIIIGVIFGLVLFVVPFSRATDLKYFEELKNDKTFKLYIMGVGQGLTVANVSLESIGQSKLYCPPDNLVLQPEILLEILQRYIEKHKNILKPDWGVEDLLLWGLKETFPCNK